MMCSIMENSFKKIYVASTNIYLSSLAVQVLVTKENLFKQIHPNYGDLVFFEYIKNEKGKYIFQKVFAYVTSMNETIITSSTKYNKDLGKCTITVCIILFSDVILKLIFIY